MATWGAKRKRSGSYGGRRVRGRKSGVYKRWSRRRGAYGTKTGVMRIKRTCRTVRMATLAESTYNNIYISANDNYTPWNIMFNLNDLPGITDLTTLFDEFRVNKLTYRFMPRFTNQEVFNDKYPTGTGNSLPTGVSTAVAIPDFLYAIDDDGRYNTGSVDGILEYGNVKVNRGNRMTTVSFTPAAFTALQTNPSGTTANMGKFKGRWIALSSSSTGVDFYGLAVGLKLPNSCVGFAGPNATPYYTWDVYVSADISLRKTL